jgi:dipeptidyl aminopeptidase/acylaminoacyl peptidase
LFVIQGERDPRVLKAESDNIVEAVRKRGGVVEYIVFPDEGHGLRNVANAITAYQRTLEFLDRHLKRAR